MQAEVRGKDGVHPWLAHGAVWSACVGVWVELTADLGRRSWNISVVGWWWWWWRCLVVIWNGGMDGQRCVDKIAALGKKEGKMESLHMEGGFAQMEIFV